MFYKILFFIRLCFIRLKSSNKYQSEEDILKSIINLGINIHYFY